MKIMDLTHYLSENRISHHVIVGNEISDRKFNKKLIPGTLQHCRLAICKIFEGWQG